MRSSKSRSRSRSNRNRLSGGNVLNRVFDSSGPDGKVRGTPQQIIEKYGQLARDAQLSNDRISAENFQQHAEHYLRLLSDAQREIDARREDQDRQKRERQVDRNNSSRRGRDSNGTVDMDGIESEGASASSNGLQSGDNAAVGMSFIPSSETRERHRQNHKEKLSNDTGRID